MSRFLFLVLSLWLLPSLYAQSETELLDSIFASPRDTHQVRALANLSFDLSVAMKEIPEALFERGIKLALELNDNRGLAELYAERYVYHLNSGNAEEGLLAVAKSIEYAGISGMERLKRSASLHEVVLFMINGETKKAADLAARRAKAFRASGDLDAASEAYCLLSTLSSGFGIQKMTLTYDSMALALARESGIDMAIAKAATISAINLCNLGFPKPALPLAEEAVRVARQMKDEIELANAMSARAQANTALGNYEEALQDYEFLKVGAGEQKSTWRMTNKGSLLQRMGRHGEARKILLEAVDLVKKTANDPLELERIYQSLQTVGLNPVQYDTVAHYGKLIKAQQDSLQTAENIKSLFELEEKYKAEEKTAEIRLQKEQLARQQTQLYATITGLLLAVLAGMLLFFLRQRLKKRNTENEQLLKDKETLIGEIHHRVKNNLQVISSLLQLQRSGLKPDDEKGREALLESQSRVSAMGLIHTKLYQGEEVTSVHMPEYLEDLGETLLDAYRLEEQVEIFYDVADIRLDVDIAIPLGLIINELVTNSMKYAFPKGQEGTIKVALHHNNGQLRLNVSDNGVGVVAAEKRADSTAFGTNLIGLLTKKLKGSLRKQKGGKGYGIEMLFSA